jgi:NADPH:quinone reductase-like Zn-dependent oxidoreductase
VKAIVQDEYGAPDVLRLEDVAMPEAGAGEVLVRVQAAGVDAGVWHLMAGEPLFVRLFGIGVRKPRCRVRGSALAGCVESVGGGVTGLRPGDEVIGSGQGSFAEYACARADRLAPKPANVSFVQAAAVPISAVTALQGLRDAAHVRPGQTVLITGAGGGVGTFAVQLAKAFGAEVTGVCGPAKVDTVRAAGADHVIDSAQDDFTQAGRRYDVIFDIAGNRPLSKLRRALAARGTLVIVGGEGGGRWLGGFGRQLVWAPLLSLVVGQTLRPLASKERAEDLLVLNELVEAGKLAPVIDRTYPLSEAPEAIRYLHDGRARGKVIVTVREQREDPGAHSHPDGAPLQV